MDSKDIITAPSVPLVEQAPPPYTPLAGQHRPPGGNYVSNNAPGYQQPLYVPPGPPSSAPYVPPRGIIGAALDVVIPGHAEQRSEKELRKEIRHAEKEAWREHKHAEKEARREIRHAEKEARREVRHTLRHGEAVVVVQQQPPVFYPPPAAPPPQMYPPPPGPPPAF